MYTPAGLSASPATNEAGTPISKECSLASQEAMLADIVRIAEEGEIDINTLASMVQYLVRSAMETRNWNALDRLAAGKFEYLDSLSVPMVARTASVTPISKVVSHRKVGRVPDWVAGYVKTTLAQTKVCGPYVLDHPDFIGDERFSVMFEGLRTRDKSKPVTLKRAVSVTLLSEATSLFERDVKRYMPEVTKNAAFFLLLAAYETLHAHSFQPSFFHKDADESTTYLDLVQALLERFPEDRFPEVYEYLSEFQFHGAEGNYLAMLMSRIEYEGDMERMAFRGKTRERVIKTLMGKTKEKAAK
ncbi:MAG: hypothetical protein QG650_373 [Patescibacteria group bacterium]|nr:hypothetical protein [Patescibacteria group bacterium]